MREQASRALKELKAYQTQYPSPYIGDSAIDDGAEQMWATSSDVVAPLFAAYDTRIAELQDTVKVLNSRIDDFQENVFNSSCLSIDIGFRVCARATNLCFICVAFVFCILFRRQLSLRKTRSCV